MMRLESGRPRAGGGTRTDRSHSHAWVRKSSTRMGEEIFHGAVGKGCSEQGMAGCSLLAHAAEAVQ